MSKNKIIIGTGLLMVAGALLLAFSGPLENNEKVRGNTNEYEINLNATNGPSSLGSSYGNASNQVRYSTINYENAKLLSGYHVELNTGGLIYNPLSSQITSITSILVNFETSGTLNLATSYDGTNFTQTPITSGVVNNTSTLPYYFKLVATDNLVKITNVKIIYSCAPHGGEVPTETRYEMFFDYSAKTTNTTATYTGNIAGHIRKSGDFNVTTLTPANIFAEKAGANDNVRFSSSKNAGSLNFIFDIELEFSKIIVETKKYGTDNTTVKIVSGTNTTGVTFSPTSATKVATTLEFTQSGPTNTITISSPAGKRFHLFSVVLVAPSSEPITDTGISANDAKTTYFTNDIYATTNQLSVQLLKSSGPAETLSYDATGANGYKYEVRNSALNIIDHTQPFTNAGTYYLDVTYKTFTAPRFSVMVSEVVPPATVTSVVAAESKLEYKVGDVYLNSNELVVTASFDDGTSKTISYNADGINGYSFTFYDPDLNEHYPNNPFTVVGDYIFTVSYKGVESNDITITVGELSISEASIKFKTNTIADSTLTTNSNIMDNLETTNINVTSVESAAVFGGSGGARFRFTSSKYAGSLKINFENEIVIQGISLDVGDYNGKTSVVKVVTAGNTTGGSQTVSSGVSKLTYTAFNSDTAPSKSLTISSAVNNQFYLYGVNITIASGDPIAVTGLTLEHETLSLGNGKTSTIVATVEPSNATNKEITWSSDNEEVATVENAKITGVSVGTANITATTVDGGFTKTMAVTVTEVNYDNYERAQTVDENWNLQDLKRGADLNAIPTTTASQNILVIPIEISDYPFAEKTITDINTLFNGTASQTNYWESVKTFYEKTSFNKQNLTFTVADKYETQKTAAQLAALTARDAQYFTDIVVRNAVKDYKAKNGNSSTQQFDSDGDGFIDAVWMVYSAPNYSNSTEIRNISEDYWAYVFWDYNQTSSTSSPKQLAYAWASYDFMYEGGGTTKVDAHTYIHETGHLLGLEDYYNYDTSKYSPMGGVDMMDYNVIDHNVWTKMSLGWQKPYVVSGDAEIVINPSQQNGDSILIADNWNGTSYDEFIMLELYTPTGLNKLDSETKYNGTYPLGFTTAGIRIMHVDARIGKKTYSTSNGWYFNGYFEPTSLTLSGNNYYDLAHSNTPSRSADSDYRLIHTIQATNVNTYKNGTRAVNNDLFQAGDTFSMETYGANFFKEGTKLNNGNDLGYTIEIIAVSDTEATIRVHKQ